MLSTPERSTMSFTRSLDHPTGYSITRSSDHAMPRSIARLPDHPMVLRLLEERLSRDGLAVRRRRAGLADERLTLEVPGVGGGSRTVRRLGRRLDDELVALPIRFRLDLSAVCSRDAVNGSVGLVSLP